MLNSTEETIKVNKKTYVVTKDRQTSLWTLIYKDVPLGKFTSRQRLEIAASNHSQQK